MSGEMKTKVKAEVKVQYRECSDGALELVGYQADVQVWDVSQTPHWRIGAFRVRAERDGDLVQLVLDRVRELLNKYRELERRAEHIEQTLKTALEEEYAEVRVEAYLEEVGEA